jgi:hypothetical protein
MVAISCRWKPEFLLRRAAYGRRRELTLSAKSGTSSNEIRRNKPAIQGGEQAEWPRLVRALAIVEDLSFYEGAGGGPNVAKVKEALKKGAMRK